ncbi:MAG: glucose-6-phosphate dehydrogenase [Acidimicrobiaceae bacterium]|nr:glucose-6-phosphate dehydrogenase [Acidimicrobiaceae bacterium]
MSYQGHRKRRIEGTTLVIFGASGDLTSRKIIPAIASLWDQDQLPEEFSVIGVARSPLGTDGFRNLVMNSAGGWETVGNYIENFHYLQGDYKSISTYQSLSKLLDTIEQSHQTGRSRLYYLATIPDLFGLISDLLGESGLSRHGDSNSARIIIEKPFGDDTLSAQKLNSDMHRSFSEDQIYRIDHYLGKETVQNLLALRFSNAIFEPVWNRNYVDNIQITVAEQIGVGHRGNFYEHAGALKDIIQNHMLQILSLILMEAPATMAADSIQNEKVKVLSSVEIPSIPEVVSRVVRGQYVDGVINSDEVRGYRGEQNVSPDSKTETFVAMRLAVDNWRWAGVPVFIRTGKRMAKRETQVVMEFNRAPHLPFTGNSARQLGPNRMILRIQPEEEIKLVFGAKVPGQDYNIRSVAMDFSYANTFREVSWDAYERLILDALLGDRTLFLRADEVTKAWEIVEPVQRAFADPDFPLFPYASGTYGPKEASKLLQGSGHYWHNG